MIITVFEIFNLNVSLYYASSRSDGPVLFALIIGLSLSHLVLEILRPKVNLIFHKNS